MKLWINGRLRLLSLVSISVPPLGLSVSAFLEQVLQQYLSGASYFAQSTKLSHLYYSLKKQMKNHVTLYCTSKKIFIISLLLLSFHLSFSVSIGNTSWHITHSAVIHPFLHIILYGFDKLPRMVGKFAGMGRKIQQLLHSSWFSLGCISVKCWLTLAAAQFIRQSWHLKLHRLLFP